MSRWLPIPNWVASAVILSAKMLDVEYLEIPGAIVHRWAPDAEQEPLVDVVELETGEVRAYALDTEVSIV